MNFEAKAEDETRGVLIVRASVETLSFDRNSFVLIATYSHIIIGLF
jgi:hypothetical protein